MSESKKYWNTSEKDFRQERLQDQHKHLPRHLKFEEEHLKFEGEGFLMMMNKSPITGLKTTQKMRGIKKRHTSISKNFKRVRIHLMASSRQIIQSKFSRHYSKTLKNRTRNVLRPHKPLKLNLSTKSRSTKHLTQTALLKMKIIRNLSPSQSMKRHRFSLRY